MPTREREARLVVLETRLLPGLLRVAIGAFPAQAACVCVGVGVTGDAFAGRRAELLAQLMATFTPHLYVGALQAVIGEIVIEGLRIQRHHVGRPPEVLRVAAAAGRSGCAWRATVEPLASRQVFRDVGMTVRTELVLGLGAKRRVALAAFRLYVGVFLNDRTGHHQLLEVDGRNAERNVEEGQSEKQ
jgi:hypothetical protein